MDMFLSVRLPTVKLTFPDQKRGAFRKGNVNVANFTSVEQFKDGVEVLGNARI